jgi:hypothetical protein
MTMRVWNIYDRSSGKQLGSFRSASDSEAHVVRQWCYWTGARRSLMNTRASRIDLPLTEERDAIRRKIEDALHLARYGTDNHQVGDVNLIKQSEDLFWELESDFHHLENQEPDTFDEAAAEARAGFIPTERYGWVPTEKYGWDLASNMRMEREREATATATFPVTRKELKILREMAHTSRGLHPNFSNKAGLMLAMADRLEAWVMAKKKEAK